MEKYSIVIPTFDDGPAVMKVINAALQSDATKIIIIGGGNIPWDEIEIIDDDRLIKIHENTRKGKAMAIMNSIDLLNEDIVFIVSGDIIFDSTIFTRIFRKFDEEVGAVVPKISVINSSNIWEKACCVLWDLHDSQIKIMTSLSQSAHGGELIAVRREILSDFKEVINDDAYLCLKSIQMGMKVIYDDESVVKSVVPSNFFDIITQRRRIIYGHIQLMKMKMDPMVMDTLLFNNIHIFFLIFVDFIRKHREDLLYLPITVAAETISMILARIDFISGKDHRVWRIVPRESR